MLYIFQNNSDENSTGYIKPKKKPPRPSGIYSELFAKEFMGQFSKNLFKVHLKTHNCLFV